MEQVERKMNGLVDLLAARPRDLWFPQLLSFRISLNKLTRHMPISTYVRQERVHLTGRPKPGLGGGNPGRLPVPLPKQNRHRHQLCPPLVNLSRDRERRVGSCLDLDGENNSARRCPPRKAYRVGEEKFPPIL